MDDSSLRGISTGLSREHDRRAQEQFHIPSAVLMENAGRAAAELLHARISPERRNAVCHCGPGNNGGDGLVVARQLLVLGWRVRVCLLRVGEGESVTRDHSWNLAAVRALGIAVRPCADEAGADDAIVVDALFGTGLTRALSGAARDAVERIMRRDARVLSLDVPSGLDADTGVALGAAVRATWTVSFAAAKRGLLRDAAKPYVGELYVRHIGVPYPLPTPR